MKKPQWITSSWNYILEHNNPLHLTKKKLKKFAINQMMGKTKKARLKEYFLNTNGYYSFKEMGLNYMVIILLVLVIIGGILMGVFHDQFQLETLSVNQFFQAFSVVIGLFFVVLFSKWRQKKHRIKCFLTMGAYDKYVFWRDDRWNPMNKHTGGRFY